MNYAALLLIAVLGASGCATHPAVTAGDLSKKREEIEVLREELAVASRSLESLQRELATKGAYPTETQARDLDYSISVFRTARDRVTAEERRIRQQYGVSHGPY
jgi:hypothetical protein